MSYCPKCGSKIEEGMSFCPKCGAPLTAATVSTAPSQAKPATYGSDEKTEEKSEKHEKREKGEKHEKREYGFIGPLVGGLVLVVFGLAIYLRVMGYTSGELWALFFVLIGILVIAGGIYGVVIAGRRHPRT